MARPVSKTEVVKNKMEELVTILMYNLYMYETKPCTSLHVVFLLSILTFLYDTLQDSVELAIHQFEKILLYYKCVCLSYVYPSVCLYLAYFSGIYLCLYWNIYLSVTH